MGIDLYDFHARQYDPQIGRFWGVDLADQFPSGYTGMGNDPANMVDPTGMIAQGSGAIGGSSGGGQDYAYHSTDPKAGYSAIMTIAMSGDYSTELDVYYYQENISGGGGGGVGVPADNDGGGDGDKGSKSETTKKTNVVGELIQGADKVAGFINSCCNPGYWFVDGGYGLVNGENLMGNPVHWTESTAQILSVIPAERFGSMIFGAAEKAIVKANQQLASKQVAQTAEQTVAKTGLTNEQLVTKAAQKAERAIGGFGRFAGTAKHTYANNLLMRYQSIYGSRGLEVNQYFKVGFNRGYLDVINRRTMTIYDYKFGNAVMSNRQFTKYSTSFPGFSIQIIRP